MPEHRRGESHCLPGPFAARFTLGFAMPIRNMRVLHGKTRTAYLRGRRCDECRQTEATYQRERRQRMKAEREAATPTDTKERP